MKNNHLQILKPFPLMIVQYGKGLLMTLLTAFALFFTGSLHAQSNTNTPISSYYSVVGNYDYQVIGNSELRTGALGESGICGVTGATSRTLSLPAGATIVKAYVHWYAMTRNSYNIGPTYQALGNISFQAPGATAVNLDATAIPGYAPFQTGFINVEGKKVDVTAALQALADPNGTYSPDINGGYPNACPLQEANTRAWTLTVVYTTIPGISHKIYLYDGLVGILGNTSTTNVSGYAVPTTGSTAGNLTGVFLQGDPGIAGESSTTSDPSFPNFPTDFGNSTTGPALDIDKLEGDYTAGSTNMNITTSTSGDFIVVAEYALKVPCPPPTITAQPTPATQTLLLNSIPTTLSVTASGAGTISYQWYNNGTTNSNTGGTAISGATNPTYIPSTTTTGTTYYYVVVTGACSSVSSSVASVIVNAPSSDLQVTKIVDKLNAAVGSNVKFTIVAKNNGSLANSSVRVTDILPSGFTFDSYTATNGTGTTYVPGTGVWTIGALANGASQTLTIYAKVQATGNYTNTAVISTTSGISDPNTTNNTASATVAIVCLQKVNGETFSAANGVAKTFNQPATNYGFVFDIFTLDNSFNMKINGIALTTQEIQFQSGTTTGINVRFVDGTLYTSGTPQIYSMAGTAATPLLRIVISSTGSVTFFGSKVSNGPLFPLELFNGNAFNPVTSNANAPNTIIVNQEVVGQTYITGRVYGQNIIPCPCYKPGILDAGNTYPTLHGITALSRAGADNGNWPMLRQSAWTVLEAKTKGFVVNRITTTALVEAIANPVKGMMVFDIQADCLKLIQQVQPQVGNVLIPKLVPNN